MATSPLSKRDILIRLSALGGLFLVLILIARTLPVVESLERFEVWMESLGAWAPLMFAGVYVTAAVIFVPDNLLRLLAGALFGLLWGVVIALLAATTAAAIAFLIGRYLAQNAVRAQAEQYPKFNAVYRAIGKEGWKIVALLRLVPILPFAVANYALGVTSIRFWPYVFATCVPRIPGTVVWVYFGHVGRLTFEAAARGEFVMEPLNIALLAIGLCATVAITIYIARVARSAIEKRVSDEQVGNRNAAAEQG